MNNLDPSFFLKINKHQYKIKKYKVTLYFTMSLLHMLHVTTHLTILITVHYA